MVQWRWTLAMTTKPVLWPRMCHSAELRGTRALFLHGPSFTTHTRVEAYTICAHFTTHVYYTLLILLCPLTKHTHTPRYPDCCGACEGHVNLCVAVLLPPSEANATSSWSLYPPPPKWIWRKVRGNKVWGSGCRRRRGEHWAVFTILVIELQLSARCTPIVPHYVCVTLCGLYPYRKQYLGFCKVYCCFHYLIVKIVH